MHLTANFRAMLSAIEAYWDEVQFPVGYDRLHEEIETVAIARLERFPSMGRPFLDAKPDTFDALVRCELLAGRALEDGVVREYMLKDYVILYVQTADVVSLLSIRHFKQTSEDFEHLWLSSR